MNKVILIGNLVKDPEVKVIENSDKVFTRLILAVNRAFTNSNGEKEADFISVSLWNKNAEAAYKFLKKGRKILVTGRICTRSYEDKEGKKKYTMEIIAESFEFLDYAKNESGVV